MPAGITSSPSGITVHGAPSLPASPRRIHRAPSGTRSTTTPRPSAAVTGERAQLWRRRLAGRDPADHDHDGLPRLAPDRAGADGERACAVERGDGRADDGRGDLERVVERLGRLRVEVAEVRRRIDPGRDDAQRLAERRRGERGGERALQRRGLPPASRRGRGRRSPRGRRRRRRARPDESDAAPRWTSAGHGCAARRADGASSSGVTPAGSTQRSPPVPAVHGGAGRCCVASSRRVTVPVGGHQRAEDEPLGPDELARRRAQREIEPQRALRRVEGAQQRLRLHVALGRRLQPRADRGAAQLVAPPRLEHAERAGAEEHGGGQSDRESSTSRGLRLPRAMPIRAAVVGGGSAGARWRGRPSGATGAPQRGAVGDRCRRPRRLSARARGGWPAVRASPVGSDVTGVASLRRGGAGAAASPAAARRGRARVGRGRRRRRRRVGLRRRRPRRAAGMCTTSPGWIMFGSSWPSRGALASRSTAVSSATSAGVASAAVDCRWSSAMLQYDSPADTVCSPSPARRRSERRIDPDFGKHDLLAGEDQIRILDHVRVGGDDLLHVLGDGVGSVSAPTASRWSDRASPTACRRARS